MQLLFMRKVFYLENISTHLRFTRKQDKFKRGGDEKNEDTHVFLTPSQINLLVS